MALLVVLAGGLSMCSQCSLPSGRGRPITGGYDVWEGTFFCDGGGRRDPLVERVRRVEWSTRAVVLAHRRGGAERYSIVWDGGRWIGCGTGDDLLGPFPLEELKAERRRLGMEAYLGRGERIGALP